MITRLVLLEDITKGNNRAQNDTLIQAKNTNKPEAKGNHSLSSEILRLNEIEISKPPTSVAQ